MTDDLLQQEKLDPAVFEDRLDSSPDLSETVDAVSQRWAGVHGAAALVAVQLVNAAEQVRLVGVQLTAKCVRCSTDLLADGFNVVGARRQSLEVALETVSLQSRVTAPVSQ